MPKKSSILNVEFEVILIIILIIVAIIMIVFLNRKFGNGKKVKLDNNNNNNKIQESFSEHSTTKMHVFYANWCGHSRNYLETHHDNVLALLGEHNLQSRFKANDVETEDGRELANTANVSLLPSFYTENNGTFTKYNFSNGINPNEILEWLQNN